VTWPLINKLVRYRVVSGIGGWFYRPRTEWFQSSFG